jgi:membrane fusion protein (multidrug efflux system)
MHLRKQIVFLCALGGAMAAVWLTSSALQSSEDTRPGTGRLGAAALVRVEPLELAEDRVVVRTVGTGDALLSAQIHPSVSGEVVQVAFKAEQHVQKGDVLVRLDDEHQLLAVQVADVALVEARREAERLNKLEPAGHVSQVRVETAVAAMKTALLRLDQAKEDLADRVVRAPFTGIVGLTDIDVGDRVTEDTMIATLDDRSAILVDFNLPEEYAARAKIGDPVVVRPWSMPDRTMTGAIQVTGSRIDPTSRTLRVRARIPNPDNSIRPGTSFEVEMTFVGRAYPKVREVAVLWSRDGAYLWRAKDGKAEKVFVKLVRRDRGQLLVDGDLRPGDQIVVEGVQGLRAGQALEAIPYAEDASADPAPPHEDGSS